MVSNDPLDAAIRDTDSSVSLTTYASFFDRLRGFLADATLGGDQDALTLMTTHRLTTAGLITAFLDRLDELAATLRLKLTAFDVPSAAEAGGAGPGDPVTALVTAMAFDADERAAIAAGGHDPAQWLDVLVQIGRAAHARGDSTMLLMSVADDEDYSVVLRALRAGMSPAGLLEHALAQAECGVRNRDLVHTFGEHGIPADLLAADAHAAEFLKEIQTGTSRYVYSDSAVERLGRDDAVTVLRALVAEQASGGQQLSVSVPHAGLLVAAGVDSAGQVLELYPLVRDGDLAPHLIQRAVVEKLDPAQWVPLLRRIGKRSVSYGRRGLLPLSVLADAADAGASVKAWDQNMRAANSHDWTVGAEALKRGPWVDIYPGAGFAGRVVELAVAGVSPAFAQECHELFEEVADESGASAWISPDHLLELHQAGLTLPLLGELRRVTSLRLEARVSLTVGQLLAALELGLTGGVLRHLYTWGNRRSFGAELVQTLQRWGGSYEMAARWLGAQKEQPSRWGVLAELPQLVAELRRARVKLFPVAVEAAELMTCTPAGDVPRLHLWHVDALVDLATRTVNRRQEPAAHRYRQAVDPLAADALAADWEEYKVATFKQQQGQGAATGDSDAEAAAAHA